MARTRNTHARRSGRGSARDEVLARDLATAIESVRRQELLWQKQCGRGKEKRRGGGIYISGAEGATYTRRRSLNADTVQAVVLFPNPPPPPTSNIISSRRSRRKDTAFCQNISAREDSNPNVTATMANIERDYLHGYATGYTSNNGMKSSWAIV
ncbi:3668_t:CDS:2 [Paraglomus brasilianum]|uniref:3668_t:CDS:1 n=1 Tax=Paraglomus brasilianum TaxID=144538 RepID=A0A9N9GVB0_9GLOM|nr:3668_t:CDS:2 [Paraglomus brasilianum]